MAFRVRTLQEVIDGMLATVLANSDITDVNRGSIVRTILEAAALQDADQYIQIARLRDIFSIETATGEDLDGRGADYKITRQQPTQAIGSVEFGDSDHTTSYSTPLVSGGTIGSGSVTLTDASLFPSTGSIVLDRSNSTQRELIAYSAKVGNVLTLVGTLTKTHAAAGVVYLSTVGSDRVIPAGQVVSVPATDSTAQIDYTTQSASTLLDGDVTSSLVTAISSLTGAATTVGAGQISLMTSPPFPTALVTNPANTYGGFDLETDDDYRQRIKEEIQALSNATVNDLLVAASNVSLASGQRVVHVQVVEEFTDPDVTVYIDDGTGTLPSIPDTGAVYETLIFPAESGQRRAHLGHWPLKKSTLNLVRSIQRGAFDIVVSGSSPATCTQSSAAWVVNAYAGRTLIDSNRNRFTITSNTATQLIVPFVAGTPPVLGNFAILSASALVPDVDYLINETTGDIELVLPGLTTGDALVALPNPNYSYSYWGGLIGEVQKVLNGDPNDLSNYPGVKASGVKVAVKSPSVLYVSFNITILSGLGTVESTLVALVQDAVMTYVNGLGVGDDVIIAEVIAAVMSVPGVTDCQVRAPLTTSNVIVLDGQLPRTSASRITVS